MTAETLAERIKHLLGQGLTTSVVANAVGCDPSYISQLLENDDFHQGVLNLRARKAEGAVHRDTKWDDIERQALERAGKLVDFITRPNELVRIAALANAAKRRSTEFSNNSENVSQTVNLVLPESAVIHFTMNANSQVVDVDGRSMAPLSSKKLQEQMAARRAVREELGVVSVMPALPEPTKGERAKVVSILEQIGYADEAVPVEKIL